MKTACILKFVIALIFCCAGTTIADKWKVESGKGRPSKTQYNHGHRDGKERPDTNDHRDYKERHDTRGHHDVKNHSDYRRHYGYRERPHDGHRVYGHHDHHGHRYYYHGHWSSWEHWDRYAKAYPHLHKYGNYYRENAHLMFRYCDPGSGDCLFFSIGR